MAVRDVTRWRLLLGCTAISVVCAMACVIAWAVSVWRQDVLEIRSGTDVVYVISFAQRVGVLRGTNPLGGGPAVSHSGRYLSDSGSSSKPWFMFSRRLRVALIPWAVPTATFTTFAVTGWWRLRSPRRETAAFAVVRSEQSNIRHAPHAAAGPERPT